MTDPRETARKRMADKQARERGDKVKDAATKGVVVGVAGSATTAAIGAVGAATASATAASLAPAAAATFVAPMAASHLAFAAPLAATGVGAPVAIALVGGLAAFAYFQRKRHN